MKKKFLAIIVVVLSIVFTSCSNIQPVSLKSNKSVTTIGGTAIRNVKWGMSKEEVMKHEKNLKDGVYDEKDALIKNEIYLGIKTGIIFVFEDDSLTLIMQKFYCDDTIDEKVYKQYLEIKEDCTKKYGIPVSEDETWLNKTFKGDVENYGLAISLGHFFLFDSWETESTSIKFSAGGTDIDIAMIVVYSPKDEK